LCIFLFFHSAALAAVTAGMASSCSGASAAAAATAAAGLTLSAPPVLLVLPPSLPRKSSGSVASPGTKERGKRAKRRKRTPKRSRTAFNYFQFAVKERLCRDHAVKDTAHTLELARGIGLSWKNLSPAEKRPFYNQAQADRKRYELENRAYLRSLRGDRRRRRFSSPFDGMHRHVSSFVVRTHSLRMPPSHFVIVSVRGPSSSFLSLCVRVCGGAAGCVRVFCCAAHYHMPLV